LAVAALLSGGRITAGQTGTIAAGALKLNGLTLGALAPAAGKTLQAADIATWLNAAGAPGVTATATNEIRVSVAGLKLDRTLTINGQTITRPDGGFTSASALVLAINAQTTNLDPTKSTGVVASFTKDGEVVLTNIATEPGKDITVGPGDSTGNVLNTTAATYTGQVSIQRALVSGQDTPVELSFGSGGTPADLARLGFRTSASIKGTVPEDVLVFVTGSGSGTTSVAASYSGSPADTAAVLRAQPMKLTFKAADRYVITDTRTGTVLAERSFNANQLSAGIDYRGLKLNFTTAPQAGDIFSLDGNTDGTGNNENMLLLAALERVPLVAGKTIGATYIDHVNDMGNISRQATIAKEALTVVHDQAVSTRDQVSGVSLDEEAANLIRFQQAYQASAKVMQVAGQLFDAVLSIR
jgi:flagellar hook-associated protein FlgK